MLQSVVLAAPREEDAAIPSKIGLCCTCSFVGTVWSNPTVDHVRNHSARVATDCDDTLDSPCRRSEACVRGRRV